MNEHTGFDLVLSDYEKAFLQPFSATLSCPTNIKKTGMAPLLVIGFLI